MREDKTLAKLIGICLIVGGVYAQNDVAINGYVLTDNRLRVESNEFSWNENRLNLRLEGAPSDRYHYFSEVRVRGFGFPNVNKTSDLQLQEKNKVQPWGLEFREAYVDLYRFGFKDLDVRIGRQIIAWGTADALNPTNNLSPDDLEDIYNFGAQLGTNAINATYYIGDASLNAVYIPVFTPATLPFGDFAEALAGPMTLPPGLIPRNLSDTIILPEPSISASSQYAIRFSTSLMNQDVSVSYFRGRDDLPLLNQVVITPVDAIGTVDIASELMYPKMQVIGTDHAGSLGDVGLWAEAAYFIPEKVDLISTLTTPIGPLADTSIALDDKPFVRYVVGGDYTFKNGLYINSQYLHGFLHERGKDNLNDYFVLRLEKTFLNGSLLLAPVSGALAITDWDDPGNNYGFVLAPEARYMPVDNVEITFGAFILDGKGTNLFGNLKDKDEFFVKIKLSF